jgi:hypothetical protein
MFDEINADPEFIDKLKHTTNPVHFGFSPKKGRIYLYE